MNILHINQSDISGGAAIAAYRLHQGLLDTSVGSKLLVDKSKIDNDLVSTIQRHRSLESLSSKLTYHLGLNYINHLSTFKVHNHPFYLDSDVLNFHNIHGGYFNYLLLPTLTRTKPAVLTLHDMWSFTGHCAYSFDCDRWKTGCGKCPNLNTYPAIARDSTAIEWKLKRWTYSHSNLVIVSPSQWLSNLAKQSLLGRCPVHTIANGLDTQKYKPLDRRGCRLSLGLPLDKKILLFAAKSIKDPRKGGDLLIGAFEKLPEALRREIILLVLGEGGSFSEASTGIPTMTLGYIGGDRVKAIAYSSADALVFPTRADNLPLTLQESMACGTPVVSFDVGGVPELVRPGITGLLAKPENSSDFAEKIVQLLEDDVLRQSMSNHCRRIAINEYSIELQARRYLSLYKQTIQDFSKGRA